MDSFSFLSNAHTAYIEGLYETYQRDPGAIDAQWKNFFEGFEFAQQYGVTASPANRISSDVPNSEKSKSQDLKKEFAVAALIEAYRSRGHLRQIQILSARERTENLNWNFQTLAWRKKILIFSLRLRNS
jgi:2-oxoglutarate dehydrogenase E1 component